MLTCARGARCRPVPTARERAAFHLFPPVSRRRCRCRCRCFVSFVLLQRLRSPPHRASRRHGLRWQHPHNNHYILRTYGHKAKDKKQKAKKAEAKLKRRRFPSPTSFSSSVSSSSLHLTPSFFSAPPPRNPRSRDPPITTTTCSTPSPSSLHQWPRCGPAPLSLLLRRHRHRRLCPCDDCAAVAVYFFLICPGSPMGCAGSKLDDIEAVALCRARFQCLEDAIRIRYELANAHASYLRALRAVGDALQGFVDGRDLLPPPSPVLPLPTQRKGDPMPPLSPAPSSPRAAAAASVGAPAAPVHHLSRSNSGSHLKFHSSDSELSDDDDGHLHSGHSSPLQFHHLGAPGGMEFMTGGGGPTTYMNYAKKGPAAPTVSYERPAMNSEVVQVGEPSYYSYPYPAQESGYYANPYPYPDPPAYSAYGGMGSFFGASSPPPAASMPPPPSTKPPPPPPSPPTVSNWDFLNPFQSYDSYYPSYTPSRSSNAVREEEGIPDLEEEESEVIKEAYGDKKFVAAGSSTVNAELYSSSKAAVDEDGRRAIGEQSRYQAGTSGAGGDDRGEYEVHLVEKNVVSDELQTRQPEEMNKRKVLPQSRVASEVVQEIRASFHRASESCDMLSRMLEVGKLPYHRKNYQVVSSKMRSAIVPPMSNNGLPSTSAEDEGSIFRVFNEEKAMKSGNLSSTLQKLYMWEKKLYEEVRVSLNVTHHELLELFDLQEVVLVGPRLSSKRAALYNFCYVFIADDQPSTMGIEFLCSLKTPVSTGRLAILIFPRLCSLLGTLTFTSGYSMRIPRMEWTFTFQTGCPHKVWFIPLVERLAPPKMLWSVDQLHHYEMITLENLAEEKMRVRHERKCKRLKHLDERGAEAHKIARTQALVKKLSTKIKIAIQVVDSISNKITTLRDVELWPQINELIQGFVTMWGAMMECHRSQCQAMIESKNLDAIVSGGKFNDAHMEATKQLELSLLSWIDAFFCWFNAQRNLVKALNDWFFKCIIYEPEITADGVIPFSPGRLGAPSVFIVCNQWLQAMDDKSHKEALTAMQAFASSVLQLWEQYRLAVRQRMMANNDMSRQIKAQEREEQVIHRAVDALNKKLVLASESNGIMLHQSHSSLQEGLKHVFDAMARFSEASVKIYEDLLARSEEERV
ncbi:hypothetical protein Taro_053779 [Colocasia esculenta]|uniref:Uncharacterized protein n=1 Tax=Colocasia esculenta TaxID=4460 RepID=A0A843XNM5_COLES|nr:hypothetical protein [Colocasia esculenta]